MTLRPVPFPILLRRLARELQSHDEQAQVLELPWRKLYLGTPGLDLSVQHHGRRAATPLGPAAGPHTQLAPNIIACWLAGCRIIELKTVQVQDQLVIPRPCIDMATIGYNVEWSQELRLEESALEYVKASMVIDMLRQGLLPELPSDAHATVFDLSVGYDLAGIQSAPVQRFLDAMRDAGPLIDQLRAHIPAELAHLGDVNFTRKISGTVTLSTFHGCPPDEIEAIARWLMAARGLDVTVKLNPTLLGKARVGTVLRDLLGYREIQVPADAFDHDPSWEQMLGIIGRLRQEADALGRSFGIKLTNTLVVTNHRRFFPPTEKVMYLSGAPLHVLASELVTRFREAFGAALPISFSAGVDRHNFPDAVSLGLVPVTVCSDLLQPGGYGRAASYLAELATRMRACMTTTIADYIRFACDATGQGECCGNARKHAAAALSDPRYAVAKNTRPPRKLDRKLSLFDCTNCDKCIPVCPNMAIFGYEAALGGPSEHQIGILADACNDCGNCDVFCPEHGGPNFEKPRFHLTRAGYEHAAPRDGVFVERTPGGFAAWARIGGREVHVTRPGSSGPGLEGDLWTLAQAVLAGGNWVSDGAPVAASEMDQHT